MRDLLEHQTRRAGETYRRAVQALVDDRRLRFMPEPWDLSVGEAEELISSASPEPDR